MIYSYGISKIGFYHLIDNTVCQDAHRVIKVNDKLAIACVADGLGSEKHSDIASKIAADDSAEYCESHIKDTMSDEEIIETIKCAFSNALNKINDAATDNEHDVTEYDTTLSLAVLINDELYFGHAGDSGIIALSTDGMYNKVTVQQRDDEGRVFPLCFEDKWIFNKFQKNVSSVLLATDGILELFYPIYIREKKVNIYVSLAEFFMSISSEDIKEFGEEALTEEIISFIDNIPSDKVDDDKTVVVITNTSTEIERQDKEYYQEPNWDKLTKEYKENWKKVAYPHLNIEENNIEEDKSIKSNSENSLLVETSNKEIKSKIVKFINKFKK